MESGYHGGLWLDLDGLFAEPARVAAFVDALAEKIRPYRVDVVCGPLQGGAFLAQLVARELGTEFCYTQRRHPERSEGSAVRTTAGSSAAARPQNDSALADPSAPARPQNDGGLFRARYELPAALVPHVRGKRVAMVDDVMSAGSSLRATLAEVRAHGGVPVVVGALMLLGSAGVDYFTGEGITAETLAREPYDLYEPSTCPMCVRGDRLEDPSMRD